MASLLAVVVLVLPVVTQQEGCLGQIGVEVGAGTRIQISDEESIRHVVAEHGLERGAGCLDSSCITAMLVSQLREAHALARRTANTSTNIFTELTMEPYRGSLVMSVALKVNGLYLAGLKAMQAAVEFETDAFRHNVTITNEIICADLKIAQSWRVRARLFSLLCPELKDEIIQYVDSVINWQPARNISVTAKTGYPVRLHLGRGTYGFDLQTIIAYSYYDTVTIGNFSSLAASTLILGGNHRTDWTTTFPFPAFHPSALHLVDSGYTDGPHVSNKGNLTIGSDVWICAGAIILNGITIHHGAVVAAGAVVTKDVLPFSIVAGNPARHIKFRFNQSTISALLEMRWWEWPDHKIVSNFPRLLRHPTAQEGFFSEADQAPLPSHTSLF